MAKYMSSSIAIRFKILWNPSHSVSSFLLISFLCVLYGSAHLGTSHAAPTSVDSFKRPWTVINGAEEGGAHVSHSSEATLVSFGVLISFVIFVILCSGGCCLNVFGKQRREEIPTTGFSNPVAEMGTSTISPIDVRALEMDPIVFEPLPPLNDLTPVSNSFYNSLPRLDGSSGVRRPRHLNIDSQPSQFVSPLSAVVPTDEASVYAHDWFDEPYRTNFRRDYIEYVKEVGKGWFGKVIEAEAKDIVPYARKLRVLVKVLREDATGIEQMRFLDESRLYRDANHGNVLKLLGHSIEKLPFLLIMEHCPQGDLKSFLIANVARAELLNSQGALVRIALDIAKGLEWMLSADFIHKDLAARNCQVGSEGRIVIGDYGLAVQNYRDDYYWGSNTAIPLRWSAPETLHCTINTIQTLKVLKSSNVWTYGVVLWEILEFGKLPYYELSDDDVISRVITDKNYTLNMPSRPGLLKKEELYKIMLSCWNPNPEMRPSMSAVVERIEETFNSLDMNSAQTPRTPNGSATKNSNEDDFDRKWESVGNRSNSSGSMNSTPATTPALVSGQDNSIIANNNNILGKKKSVSFVGMKEDLLPDVQIITPRVGSVSKQVPAECISPSYGVASSSTSEKSLIPKASNSNGSGKLSAVASTGRDDEQLWKLSGSDPEEESIELAVISEKVREKSQSVQNLMVLTHVEPSDLSDPESLIILAQGHANGKNAMNSAHDVINMRNNTADMVRNGVVAGITSISASKTASSGNSFSSSSVSNNRSDSGTFTASNSIMTQSKSPYYSHVNEEEPKTEENSRTATFDATVIINQQTSSTEKLQEVAVSLGETFDDSPATENSTTPFSEKSAWHQKAVSATSPVSDDTNKFSTSWETFAEGGDTSSSRPLLCVTSASAEDVSQDSKPSPGISFRVIPPTPSPNISSAEPPVISGPQSTARPQNDHPVEKDHVTNKPAVRFVVEDGEAEIEKIANKVQQNYRSRMTSTPNASPNTTLDSDSSSVFHESSAEVFKDFSMEIAEPLSPITKQKQISGIWPSELEAGRGNFGPSSVLLGPSDDLGLKPYQRVTTELNLLDSSGSEDWIFEPTGTNNVWTNTQPSAMDMLTTIDDSLQPSKSGFMDLFGHTGMTPTPQPQRMFMGTYSNAGATDESTSSATPAVIIRKLEFESETNIGELPGVSATEIFETTPHSVMTEVMDPSDHPKQVAASGDTKFNATDEITHISESPSTPPASAPHAVFKIGAQSEIKSGEDGVTEEDRLPKDKFVEDIEAAAEELGSLVMTDLEEENAQVEVIKETREDDDTPSVENTVINLQTKKAFELSLDATNSSSATDGETGDATLEKTDNETRVEYVELPDSSSKVSKFDAENSRTLLYPGDSDCEAEDDDKDDTESICRDFVPSKWNQNLAPTKPAIKSPEQQKIQTETPERSTLEKSALKKSVSFERKKTQLVYEYPPPPVPSDSDEEDKHQARSLRSSGGHFNATLDWELQPEELENADLQHEDWEDEVVPKRSDNPMDVYRISGFDTFQVRASDQPFEFRPPPPPRLFTLQSSAASSSFTASSFASGASSSTPPIPPVNDTSTLGELRHTRSRLKLDLAKGEASLLDSEAFSAGTKVSGGKPQQIDSGVGSSTNVSPFNNCDNNGKL